MEKISAPKNTLTEGRWGQFPSAICRSGGIFALRLLKIFKKIIKSKALYFAIALLIQLTILFVLIIEMDFNHFF